MQKLFVRYNESILKFGIVALLLVIPLYPKFPLFEVPGSYVSIRAEDFLISILGVCWFAHVIRTKALFFRDEICKNLVLFFAAGLLSVVSAVLLTQTVLPHIGLLHWGRRVEYAIPFFVALTVAKNSKRTRLFLEVLFTATFLVFIYGLGQTYLNFPVISTQNAEYSKGLALNWIPGARLPSTFAGHYDLSAFLVMIFPISLASFFFYKKWYARILLFLLVIAPSFWLMLRTESRVSFIAYLFGASVTLWAIQRKRLIPPLLLISALLAIFFSGLGARYRFSIETSLRRLRSQVQYTIAKPVYAAEDGVASGRTRSSQNIPEIPMAGFMEDRSTAIRLNIEWPRAFRAFAKNPLLGTGYSSIGLATDNDYLRLLGEVGAIGALAFLVVLANIVTPLMRKFNHANLDANSALIAGFLGGFLGICLNATFIDVFEASKVAIIFWTLAGLSLGAVYKVSRENQNK